MAAGVTFLLKRFGKCFGFFFEFIANELSSASIIEI
jgi:hypothetical protein